MIHEIFFIVGIIVFLIAIWSVKDEKISRTAKAILTTVILFCGIGAYIFENATNKNESKNLELLAKFKQGNILICAEHNVTNVKFNYEFGTACFMPKREFKELNGVVIKISDCTVLSEELK